MWGGPVPKEGTIFGQNACCRYWLIGKLSHKNALIIVKFQLWWFKDRANKHVSSPRPAEFRLEEGRDSGKLRRRRKALQEKSLAGGPAHFSQASLSWKALLSLTWCCSISQRWSACRRTFFHINANSGLPFSTSGYFWRDQPERSFKQLLLVQ